MEDLTVSDCDLIIEALGYKKMKIENYQGYPSYEFKQKQLADTNAVLDKIRKIKTGLHK
jgi:hypothetical protein